MNEPTKATKSNQRMAESMTNVAEAKRYYDWLLRTRDLSHGLRLTRDSSRLHLIQDWDWVFEGVTFEDFENKKIPIFASPWHACVFLYKQMALWANDDLSSEPRASTALELGLDPLPPIVLLFRGQRNPGPDWKIESSLNRKEGATRGEAVSASLRFTALLQKTLEECGFPFVDPLALLAAAQHYGIPTDLLDFTPDPAVAVYFANERQEDPDVGVVFGISWSKAWNRFGFQIVLPPPLIERLYLQRGVFLEYDYSRADEFRRECIEVRFRKHPEFVIVREDKPETNILKDDSFLRALADTSREWASAGNRWQSAFPSWRAEWLQRYYQELKPHLTSDFDQGLHRDAIGLWMNHSVDLIEGLSLGRTKHHGTQLISNVIESLVISNPILSTLISSYYYGQFYAYHWSRDRFEVQEAHAYQLAREISKALRAVAGKDLLPKLAINTT